MGRPTRSARPDRRTGPGMGVLPTPVNAGPATGGDFALADALAGNGGGDAPGMAGQPGGLGERGELGSLSGGDVQTWLDQRNSVEPHGWTDLGPFNPRDMAIGAALGQAPLGGMAGAIGGAIYNAFNGTPSKPSKVATDFAMSMPFVGPAVGFGHWLSGTPYAQNNPVATFSREGENEATTLADRMFRSGGTPQQMQAAFDAVRAAQNAGGAGNPAAVARQQWDAMMRDGNIHIGEPGWENPNAVTVGGTIDNSVPDMSGIGIVNPGASIDFGSGTTAQGTINNDPNALGGVLGGDMGTGLIDSGSGGASWDSDLGDNQTISDTMAEFGFAKGGRVPSPMPGMMNPPGPDDQYAALQSGEMVLSRADLAKGPKHVAEMVKAMRSRHGKA